jgi:hypothetical protein
MAPPPELLETYLHTMPLLFTCQRLLGPLAGIRKAGPLGWAGRIPTKAGLFYDPGIQVSEKYSDYFGKECQGNCRINEYLGGPA